MDVTLTIERGPASIRRIRLRSPETIIGRQKGCDIRIPSAEVSRRHCLLSFANGQLMVEDLESVNGTFINQVPIKGRQTLQAGDRLKVGPLTFSVDYAAPPKVQALSDETDGSNGQEHQTPKRDDKLAPAPGNADDEPIRLVGIDPPALRGLKSQPTPPPSDPGPIPFKNDHRSEEAVNVEFDDAEPLHLPEGENFRDLLSRMDE